MANGDVGTDDAARLPPCDGLTVTLSFGYYAPSGPQKIDDVGQGRVLMGQNVNLERL